MAAQNVGKCFYSSGISVISLTCTHQASADANEILNVDSKASVQTRGLWQLAEHPCFSEQDTFSFQRQKDFQDT